MVHMSKSLFCMKEMHLCICGGAFRALPTPPSNSCRKLGSSCWQSARMTGPTVPLGKQRLSRYETAWESEAGRLAEVYRHPGCSLELYSCCTGFGLFGPDPPRQRRGFLLSFGFPRVTRNGSKCFPVGRIPTMRCGWARWKKHHKPPARASYKPYSMQVTTD